MQEKKKIFRNSYGDQYRAAHCQDSFYTDKKYM